MIFLRVTTLMSSNQASNVELSMESSLITEAVLCVLLAIIFENVHNLSTGCAESLLKPQHFLIFPCSSTLY